MKISLLLFVVFVLVASSLARRYVCDMCDGVVLIISAGIIFLIWLIKK
jgi:hypothetical protein